MWLLIALPSESFSLTRRNENGSNVHKTGHPIDYHKERLRDRRKFGTYKSITRKLTKTSVRFEINVGA